MEENIEPQVLKAWLRDGGELALIDVREEGEFSLNHLLLASCIPLSHMEFRVGRMLPRKTVRIVLVDGHGAAKGSAQRARVLLRRHGYESVHVLKGGIAGWKGAGFALFSGINVPSKAFGEIVEHRDGTPSISAEELDGLLASGSRPLVVDSRTFAEYRQSTIPTSISCPGAELVYRVPGMVSGPEQLVVVNCAGRTRSIIGAQSLISAGLPNRVVALRNGVMGWRLQGLSPEEGAARYAPVPKSEAVRKSLSAALSISSTEMVRSITPDEIASLQNDPDRTTYVLDVRSPEEYRRGHLANSLSAPGGQLVQATDTYLPVRNARVIVVDDTGTRAAMTAWWLARMGWKEVLTSSVGTDLATASGEGPTWLLGGSPASAEVVNVDAIAKQIEEGAAVVLDLADSLSYRRGHIPGAWFIVRSRLATDLQKVPTTAAVKIVVSSPSDTFSHLCAPEVAALTDKKVVVLEGGTNSWTASNRPLETGHAHMASEPTDVWYRPVERSVGVQAAMQEYLSWEIGLVERVIEDGDAPFIHLASNAAAQTEDR